MRSFVRLLGTFALSHSLATLVDAQWRPIPSGTTDSLTAITWVDGRFMVAGSSLTFLRSLDNGLTFTATGGYAPGYDESPFTHLSFHDSLVGFGTSTLACCMMQSTTDGGITWNEVFPNDDYVRMRLALNSTDQIIFKSGGGLRFGADGRLLQETDMVVLAEIDSVCPVPDFGDCSVDVSGEDTTYTTHGHGWTLTSNDRGGTVQTGVFPYASYLYDAQVVSGGTVAYIDYASELRTSHDKGVSWTKRGRLPHNVINRLTLAFRMYSSAHGAAWGDDGQIHLTVDSGTTWFAIPTPSPARLYDILFVDDMHVLAVGDAGTILSSSDGGYTWEIEESGTTERIHALATSGEATIAIGTNGTILRRFPAHAGMDLTTGLPAKASEGFTLFPNPASGAINVRCTSFEGNSKPTFTATDTFGRKHGLQAYPGASGSWAVDITGLASGVHTLHYSKGDTAGKRTFLVIQ